jgi:hypothetical protein
MGMGERAQGELFEPVAQVQTGKRQCKIVMQITVKTELLV